MGTTVSLTKTFIDGVQPPASGYVILWDKRVPGYGLRVTAAGAKAFVAQGRVRGRTVVVTIGKYGTYTEDQARKRAQSLLQQMREGVDPRDMRRTEEAEKVTLRQVMQSYLDRPGKLTESTKVEIRRHITVALASWADKPVADITEEMVRKQYRLYATTGLHGDRKGGSPGQASIAFGTLRALVNYAGRQYKRADGTAIITNNPVDALNDDWMPIKPRTGYIPAAKIGAVWHVLSARGAELESNVARGDGRFDPHDIENLTSMELVKFLLLTGARLMEAAALRWENVNLDEAWWHIPNPKNHNPVWLPLSTQAIALLKARKERRGDGVGVRGSSAFVFPTKSKAGHIHDPRAALQRIEEAAGYRPIAHDLRRTFVTIGVAELKLDFYKVELLTNHVPKGVTARHYLETQHLQYLLAEVQRIGDFIEAQGKVAAAQAAGENVVALRA
ncbi:tyrosine-type recombinase/integrase [Xanthobacter autotrophicus]|uniref:tyrosine-type recombinase/integrase n=1 Tax=Xanthobacter autotrophicus TaxID=280 RepID=UPI0024A74CE4|nr:site-specific integrase [Xanthobacter autotrophicus]MDI4656577.1 integrase arm-type DNA-binding domain-containing protein [Xanthobacter autotrophicus]